MHHRIATLVTGLLHAIHLIEGGLLILLLSAMIVLAAGQIVMRNLFGTGLAENDQLLRVLVLWVGLLGAVAASHHDRHINVDVLSRLLSPRARLRLRVGLDLFTAGVSGLLAWHAGRFVHTEYQAGARVFDQLPAWVAELILPVAFGIITIRYLVLCAHHLRQSRIGEHPA